MKKIFALALCSIAMGSTMAYAEETEAQAEMNGYIQDGLAKFTSSNGLYSFRVGARAFIDGSYYFDDYTVVPVQTYRQPVYVCSASWEIISILNSMLTLCRKETCLKTFTCDGIRTKTDSLCLVILSNRSLPRIYRPL